MFGTAAPEYMLVDHQRREYFDLGKFFATDAFKAFEDFQRALGARAECYGHVIRRPSSVSELEKWLREELSSNFHSEGWGPLALALLPDIAEQIFGFLRARPNVRCMHSDCSWDIENYVEVGTRYRNLMVDCLGCRTGAPKVFKEKDTTADVVDVPHEHFGVAFVDGVCRGCDKHYSEHPLANEYPIDEWEYHGENDPAYGPFLRRLCNGDLVKWDIAPEPAPLGIRKKS